MIKRRTPHGRDRAPAPRAPLSIHITRRQEQIVNLLLEGCTNKEIASRLGISDQTVKNQLTALYQKTSVKSRLELVLLALRVGLKPDA